MLNRCKITNRGRFRDFKSGQKDCKSGQRFQMKAKRFQIGAEITNGDNRDYKSGKNRSYFQYILGLVGQLSINSIRNKFGALCSIFHQKIDILLISETKIDNTFPLAQFRVAGYSTPYRVDRACKGGRFFIVCQGWYTFQSN